MSPWPWEAPLLHAGILITAMLWDALLGEVPVRLHPVVWMGRAIRAWRAAAPETGLATRFAWGLLWATLLPAISGCLAWALVQIQWVGIPLAVFLLQASLARRTLGEAGLRVGDAINRGDIASGRDGLSWLCSRDPADLGASELSGAALESISENASDSVVAPAFWFLLFGVPGAVAYRCINTADAMVGYRDRYEWLGKAVARIDDVANIIPARLTALTLLLAGLTVSRSSSRRGLRAALRDARSTDSPNAGWPMATLAGQLDVRLSKRGQYLLHEAGREPNGTDILIGWQIVSRACWLSVLAVAAALLIAATVGST